MRPCRVLPCPPLIPLQRFYRWFSGANFPWSYNNSILIAQVPACHADLVCWLWPACLPACLYWLVAFGGHACCLRSILPVMLLPLCHFALLLAANESCRYPPLGTRSTGRGTAETPSAHE